MREDDLELLCFGGFAFIFRVVVDLSKPHFGCRLVCVFFVCVRVLFLPDGIIQYYAVVSFFGFPLVMCGSWLQRLPQKRTRT